MVIIGTEAIASRATPVMTAARSARELVSRARNLLSTNLAARIFLPDALEALTTAITDVVKARQIQRLENIVSILAEFLESERGNERLNAANPEIENTQTEQRLNDLASRLFQETGKIFLVAFVEEDSGYRIMIAEEVDESARQEASGETEKTSAAWQARLIEKLNNLDFEQLVVGSTLVVASLANPYFVPGTVVAATVAGRIVHEVINSYITPSALRTAVRYAFHEGARTAAARFIDLSQ